MRKNCLPTWVFVCRGLNDRVGLFDYSSVITPTLGIEASLFRYELPIWANGNYPSALCICWNNPLSFPDSLRVQHYSVTLGMEAKRFSGRLAYTDECEKFSYSHHLN
jgi:hypothetical protein